MSNDSLTRRRDRLPRPLLPAAALPRSLPAGGKAEEGAQGYGIKGAAHLQSIAGAAAEDEIPAAQQAGQSLGVAEEMPPRRNVPESARIQDLDAKIEEEERWAEERWV